MKKYILPLILVACSGSNVTSSSNPEILGAGGNSSVIVTGSGGIVSTGGNSFGGNSFGGNSFTGGTVSNGGTDVGGLNSTGGVLNNYSGGASSIYNTAGNNSIDIHVTGGQGSSTDLSSTGGTGSTIDVSSSGGSGLTIDTPPTTGGIGNTTDLSQGGGNSTDLIQGGKSSQDFPNTGGNYSTETGGSTSIDYPSCLKTDLNNINVYVIKDVNNTGVGADTEGNMYVGGNFYSSSGYSIGKKTELLIVLNIH